MEHVIRMDSATKELQDNLKQNLVNTIMDENTFIRSVDYVDPDAVGNAEQSVKIDFLVADSVELTDCSAT